MKGTATFLLLQMADQELKTRMIQETTKSTKLRIRERVKVTPTIRAIFCLRTMKNKIKVTSLIHLDLRISTEENQ